MMKKIGLFFICFICVFDSAFARISVVNSVDNMIYINWEAVNVASEGITVVNNGDTDCASLAHRTIGTVESGAIRASFGIFNRETDIEALCRAIRKLN